jgi:hypothetical protein
LTIDPATGTVLSGTLTAAAPERISTTFTVRYAEDAATKLVVPVEMHETYWYPDKPNEDRLDATMTYSSFRRFQVSTSEVIK